MMYSTVADYETAISQTQDAIARILLVGIEHENDSGGGRRRHKEIELEDLRSHLNLLQAEKAAIEGTGGFGIRFTPGW